jgi:hypothetical protein
MLLQALVDLMQSKVTVDTWLAGAKEVQIGAM